MKIKVVFCLIAVLLNSKNLFSQFRVVTKQENIKEVSLNIEIDKTPETIKNDNILLLNTKEETKKKEIKLIVSPIGKEHYITSAFGSRVHPIDKVVKFHSGVDIRAKQDTVYAVFGGEVKFSGYSNSLGYYVQIDFKEYSAIYGHLSEYYVLSGSAVRTGDKIGLTGNTGKSTAEHLHFSLKKGDKYINPQTLFNYLNNLSYDL